MNIPISPGQVVVAVDGSSAAIGAAVWAAREALHHDVPLQLLHVVLAPGDGIKLTNAHSIEDEYAETCLRAACSAVKELDLPIQIDTAVLHGDIESALIAESDGATLLCLGSVGIGRLAAAAFGSTAATVAQRARCAVAIIRRTRDRPPPDTGFIAVILDDGPGSAEAMQLGHGGSPCPARPLVGVRYYVAPTSPHRLRPIRPATSSVVATLSGRDGGDSNDADESGPVSGGFRRRTSTCRHRQQQRRSGDGAGWPTHCLDTQPCRLLCAHRSRSGSEGGFHSPSTTFTQDERDGAMTAVPCRRYFVHIGEPATPPARLTGAAIEASPCWRHVKLCS